jgi:hypothetical protein
MLQRLGLLRVVDQVLHLIHACLIEIPADGDEAGGVSFRDAAARRAHGLVDFVFGARPHPSPLREQNPTLGAECGVGELLLLFVCVVPLFLDESVAASIHRHLDRLSDLSP